MLTLVKLTGAMAVFAFIAIAFFALGGDGLLRALTPNGRAFARRAHLVRPGMLGSEVKSEMQAWWHTVTVGRYAEGLAVYIDACRRDGSDRCHPSLTIWIEYPLEFMPQELEFPRADFVPDMEGYITMGPMSQHTLRPMAWETVESVLLRGRVATVDHNSEIPLSDWTMRWRMRQ